MYIAIEKDTQKAVVTEAKTDLAKIIGVHFNTVSNRLEKNNPFETDKHIVYKANTFYKRKRSGNRDDMETKKGKIEGIIPKNTDK